LEEVPMQRTFLSYIPVDSIFMKVSASTKLSFFFLFNFYPFFISNPLLNFLSGIIAFLLTLRARVNLRTISKYYKLFLTLAFIIFVSSAFFGESLAGPSREVIVRLGPINVYKGAMAFGLEAYSRVFALVCGMLFWLAITTGTELFAALEKLRIGYNLRISIVMIFRYFSVFDGDYHVIREAEKSRALDLSTIPIYKRPLHFAYYLVPLVMLVIKRALETGAAMESRAFKGTKLYKGMISKGKETYLTKKYYRLERVDVLAIISMIAILAVILVGRFYFGWAWFMNPFY